MVSAPQLHLTIRLTSSYQQPSHSSFQPRYPRIKTKTMPKSRRVTNDDIDEIFSDESSFYGTYTFTDLVIMSIYPNH
jgi:hypothetical protein